MKFPFSFLLGWIRIRDLKGHSVLDPVWRPLGFIDKPQLNVSKMGTQSLVQNLTLVKANFY